jgi:crotonobetainyl-CoA:carnitine CoA-transferase CaiB-like acyl-CoA transferase
MGAEVIRIEPTGGVDSRRTGPFVNDAPDTEHSIYFWHYNAGKRSVVLDVEHDQDRAALRRLLAGVDVFVESMEPGEAARLGLDYALLSGENQRAGDVLDHAVWAGRAVGAPQDH